MASAKARCFGCWIRPAPPWAGRLLRRRISQPLLDVASLDQRLDAVEAWVNTALDRAEMRELLRKIGDIERWTNRCTQKIALPRDLVGLRESLETLPEVRAIAERVGQAEGLDLCPEVLDLLSTAIAEDPPVTLATGGVIRPGYNAELDTITLAAKDARCLHRRTGKTRAREHRHPEVKGRVQQSIRVLPGGDQSQHPSRA